MKKICSVILFALFLLSPVFAKDSEEGFKQVAASEEDAGKKENTDILNQEGVQSAQLGDYKTAIRQFEKAIAIQDGKAAVSYNNLAYTYMLAGDRKNAIINYKKALERNPSLLPAIANLGRLLYETEQFEEAIIYGEKLLKKDPYNQEVRKWLPDAYRMAAQRRMEELQRQNEAKQDDTNGPASVDQTKPMKRPPSEIGYAVGAQFRYNKVPASKFQQKYKTITLAQYGPPSSSLYPMDVFGNFWLSPEVQFRLDIRSPYSVMEFPSFVSGEERMEFLFYGKRAFFGAGILFSQSNFAEDRIPASGQFIANSFPKRDDVKLGLIYGYRSEYDYFTISVFPRYLFTDTKKGPQSIEYDLSKFYVEYRRTVPANESRKILPGHLEMALIMDINEAYVVEYLAPVKNKTRGHFFAVYDFTVDITFGKIQPMFKKVPMVFGFSLTERLYFYEINEVNPFTYGNGFGFFGFDWLKSTAGKPFPSFHANSGIITVYLQQMFANKIILKEEIGYEISSTAGDFNSFSFDLAVGYSF